MNRIEKLKNNLLKYKYILFDLDNTIYNQDSFDFIQYKNFFNLYYNTKESNILAKELLELKNTKSYNYKYLFNDFFKIKNINLKIEDILYFYKNPKLNIINPCNSLFNLLKKLYLKKNLYLITNGYKNTQNVKIDSLKIRTFFKEIYILDPNEQISLKPSNEVLSYLNIDINNSVYVGDNLEIDSKFAENSNIDFIHFKF